MNTTNLKKIGIIIFIAGLFIGVLTTGLIIIINQSLTQNSNTIINNKSGINNTIQSEDLFPRIEMMTSFSGNIIEKKSDKELIVNLNNKNITVILDENTKIVKQSMKTPEQQRIDLENYNRKRNENPEDQISPELPFLEVEVPFNELKSDSNIRVMSEDNVIGKSEVKALRIIYNNNNVE